eukprot:11181048-Lingulodinium_polyedra.AAC.1
MASQAVSSSGSHAAPTGARQASMRGCHLGAALGQQRAGLEAHGPGTGHRDLEALGRLHRREPKE